MAGNRMGEQTREKILAAAREEFVNRGFEPAKMEDIAARAGVTKVMLYYHFNTKQNIFREIINMTVKEIKTEFSTRMKPSDFTNPEDFQNHLRQMLDYYRSHRQILRMILAEYLSPRSSAEESLGIFGDFFHMLFEQTSLDQTVDRDGLLTRVFFFNALPMILYSCLDDTFCQNFSIEADEAQRVFLDAFTRIFAQNLIPSGKGTAAT